MDTADPDQLVRDADGVRVVLRTTDAPEAARTLLLEYGACCSSTGQVPSAEPLSAAALQVLAIIAYEQPVTRADISRIRSVDSDGVVASLITRKLIAEEHRFALRGASVPLITSAAFLRQFGLASLAQLPALGQFYAQAASRIAAG
jgi:chromosome segregation and condensation protein ScpB